MQCFVNLIKRFYPTVGDFVKFFLSLRTMQVRMHFNENRANIKYLVDKKIENDLDANEILQAEEILRLAVKCTSRPSLRPEISEVVKILNNIANKKAAYEKRPAKESSTAGEGSGSSA